MRTASFVSGDNPSETGARRKINVARGFPASRKTGRRSEKNDECTIFDNANSAARRRSRPHVKLPSYSRYVVNAAKTKTIELMARIYCFVWFSFCFYDTIESIVGG